MAPSDNREGITCAVVGGRLLDGGCDPLQKKQPMLSQFSQTESVEQLVARAIEAMQSQESKPVEESMTSCSTVLRLAVGLLGLEVHEKPSPWAEAWLSFQDAIGNKMGLGTPMEFTEDGPDKEQMAQAQRVREERHEREEQLVAWQGKVLSHLKAHIVKQVAASEARPTSDVTDEPVVPSRRGSTSGLPGTFLAPPIVAHSGELRNSHQVVLSPSAVVGLGGHVPWSSHYWGPDFLEHLQLAEFMIRRIACAVSILLNPEKEDRPMVLREYTEKMVLQVCRDLKQWLEQLSMLVSIYHVHLLDLDRERNRLTARLGAAVERGDELEAKLKKVDARHHVLEKHWQEEKMKRRAEAVLGITLGGADAKIYSQMEMEDMKKEWYLKEVIPLLEELKELRGDAKSGHPGPKRPPAQRAGSKEGLTSSALGPLTVALRSLAEVCPNETIADFLNQLVDAIPDTEKLRAILKEIQQMTSLLAAEKEQLLNWSRAGGTGGAGGKPGGGGRGGGGDDDDDVDENGHVRGGGKRSGPQTGSVVACLSVLANEFDTLHKKLRPPNSVADFIAWGRDTVNVCKTAVKSAGIKAKCTWMPAPDVTSESTGGLSSFGGRSGKGATATVGVQAGSVGGGFAGGTGGGGAGGGAGMDEDGPGGAVQQQVNGTLQQVRSELERQMDSQRLAAESWRKKFEELMEQLAAERKEAQAKAQELKRRIKELEKLLAAKGLGKLAGDLLFQAGLTDFANGRNVFERLYQDALDRMKRLAKAQQELFETSSREFLRTLDAMLGTPAWPVQLIGSNLVEAWPPSPGRAPIARYGAGVADAAGAIPAAVAPSSSPRPAEKPLFGLEATFSGPALIEHAAPMKGLGIRLGRLPQDGARDPSPPRGPIVSRQPLQPLILHAEDLKKPGGLRNGANRPMVIDSWAALPAAKKGALAGGEDAKVELKGHPEAGAGGTAGLAAAGHGSRPSESRVAEAAVGGIGGKAIGPAGGAAMPAVAVDGCARHQEADRPTTSWNVRSERVATLAADALAQNAGTARLGGSLLLPPGSASGDRRSRSGAPGSRKGARPLSNGGIAALAGRQPVGSRSTPNLGVGAQVAS